jgi:prepilin-type processing-associated H-X9-DG protein
VYRLGLLPPARDFRSSATASNQRFGSSHLNGINALFCDGSVRPVRFSVSQLTWQLACTRDDGLVYNDNEF